MYELLNQIKTTLQNIGAKTIDLGIEDGISASDTPFIRIVPTNSEIIDNKETLEFEIYIGTDIKSNLNDTYKEHMNFLENIKNTLHLKEFNNKICLFQKVIFDKDIIKHFKSAMISFVLKDIFD